MPVGSCTMREEMGTSGRVRLDAAFEARECTTGSGSLVTWWELDGLTSTGTAICASCSERLKRANYSRSGQRNGNRNPYFSSDIICTKSEGDLPDYQNQDHSSSPRHPSQMVK